MKSLFDTWLGPLRPFQKYPLCLSNTIGFVPKNINPPPTPAKTWPNNIGKIVSRLNPNYPCEIDLKENPINTPKPVSRNAR